jgi:hypothetical protein
MPRNPRIEEPWETEAKAKIAHLRGAARLEPIWQIAQTRGELGDTDGKLRWLKGFLSITSEEALFDQKIRAVAEIRRMFESDPAHPKLRHDALWYYKWLAEDMPEYADVPLTTIDQYFDDMQAFYQAAREPLGPIYSIRCEAAMIMGRNDEADRWYEKWQQTPRGKLDDCAACVAARQMKYFLYKERDVEALAAADPILKGKSFCDETPAALTLLVGILRQKGAQRAAVLILKACGRPIRKTPNFLSALGLHVTNNFLCGNFLRSQRLAIVGLNRARQVKSEFHQYNFYRHCGVWAAIASMASAKAAIPKMTLPRKYLPGIDENGATRAELPEVAAACLETARQIGTRFDARNGNSHYVNRLQKLEENIRDMIRTLGRGDRAV